MTKDELKELIKSTVEELRVANPEAAIIDKPQSKDFNIDSALREFGVTHVPQGGGYLLTEKGSVINTNRPSSPFVKLSPELEGWAKGFQEYVKSKGRTVSKVLEEQSDPAGGYTVPEEFQATLVQYETEPAIVWPRATIWPMSTDKLGMPKLAQRPDEDDSNFDHFAGVSFTWTDEGGTKTETEPSFEFLELIAHELSGYTAITNILLEDSAINMINFLTLLFRKAYVWQTDRSFIRGTGARQPLGVRWDPTVNLVARQTAGAFTFTDAINMENQLPSVFDDGAVWFMNKRVLNSLRNERDTNNALLLQETYSPGVGGVGSPRVTYLLGYPVILSDNKTYALGATADVILGNWNWYYIGDRRRFSMDISTHYLFRNNRTAMRVTGRLDGQPAIGEAFVILGVTGGGS